MSLELGAVALQQAFDRFSNASASLERTHELLRLHAERLERELLSARSRLEEELGERQRVAAWLAGVLDALACGVVVIAPGEDVRGRAVSGANPAAMKILEVAGDDLTGSRVGDLPRVVAEALESLTSGGARADCGGRKVEATASRVRDLSGAHLGDVVVVYDVTEVHRLEEAARRRSRMEAMGRLSAEIAHEIRNPLGSLDLTAGLLREALAGQPEHRDLAEQILLGVQMLNAAVVRALSLARTVSARMERVDVASLAREVFTYLEAVARSRQVALLQDVDGPCFIDADRELFRQLTLNLIHNALEAAGPGGMVGVRLRPRDDRPLLTITDNGPGIAPEDRSRIFEPLFTKKENGTGLGLAIVQRAADEHGWRVRVRSVPGRGTTVTVEMFARPSHARTKGRKDAAIGSGR